MMVRSAFDLEIRRGKKSSPVPGLVGLGEPGIVTGGLKLYFTMNPEQKSDVQHLTNTSHNEDNEDDLFVSFVPVGESAIAACSDVQRRCYN